jgi:hypothetical protein
MKFSHLYEELKLLDICKPVSPEEAKKRDKEGQATKIKEVLDTVKKTKLPDGTWHAHGDLDVSYMNLSTLENLNVSIVDGSFNCSNNTLTSLEGCPNEIRDGFYCLNTNLTSLEGSPAKVNGNFDCNYNKLTSLKGCPKEIGGNFYCYKNIKKFTEDEVKALCDVKGKIEV